jgi:hypothetical protein
VTRMPSADTVDAHRANSSTRQPGEEAGRRGASPTRTRSCGPCSLATPIFGWPAGSAMLQTYVAAHADAIAHEEFARLMR